MSSASQRERIRAALGENETVSLLPRESIESLLPRCRLRRYAPGETILSPQSGLDGAAVIVSGRIRYISTSRGGQDMILSIGERPGSFGEVAVLDGTPWAATAVAEQETEIAVIPRRDFLELFDRHPEFALGVARRLAEFVRMGTEIVDDLVLQDAGARLFGRLMILARQHGRIDAVTDSLRIEHGLSQQGLAESANLSRVSVNRQLAEWRAAGVVRTGSGWIEIPDREALQARVWSQKEGD